MNILKTQSWLSEKMMQIILIFATIIVCYTLHLYVVVDKQTQIIDLKTKVTSLVEDNSKLEKSLKAQSDAVEDLSKEADKLSSESAIKSAMIIEQTNQKRKLAKDLAEEKSKGSLIEDCKAFEKNINDDLWSKP